MVAAFDFDGTLTDRGSVWPFLAALGGRRRLWTAAIRLAPRLVSGAIVGGHHADEAKELLFEAVLSGLPAKPAAADAAAFARRHFAGHARKDTVARLRAHQAAGHLVVIVSASPELYLRAVASDLGVVGLIATGLAVDTSGRLTGCYDGANCRGEAKRDRLQAWVAQVAAEQGAAPRLWAYGNSAGDQAMLASADVPVDVGRLGRLGRLRRFPRLADVPAPQAPAPQAPAPPPSPGRQPPDHTLPGRWRRGPLR